MQSDVTNIYSPNMPPRKAIRNSLFDNLNVTQLLGYIPVQFGKRFLSKCTENVPFFRALSFAQCACCILFIG